MSEHPSSPIATCSPQALAELVWRHTADYAVIVSDPAGVIVAWNPSAEAVLGWRAEEAIGQHSRLFFTPEDRAAGWPATEMRIAAETGCSLDERWHLRRDGSRFWASGELSPLREAGVLLGFVKIVRDRTRARLTEQRLRLTQEVGRIGSFELYPERQAVMVSPELCRLWGLAVQEEYPLATLVALVHPDDRPGLPADASGPVGPPDYAELRIRRADTGKERWLALRGEAAHIEADHGPCYLGVCYDITEQRRQAQAWRESEARFKAITHSIEQIVWACRSDGAVDFFNERWYAYTGLPETAAGEVDWWDLVHPEDHTDVVDAWQSSLASGAPYRSECRIRGEQGRYRCFLARAHAVRDEASGAVVRWFGTLTDIQDIVDAREVLARSQDELERQVAERTRERDRIWRLSNDLMMAARIDSTLIAANEACNRTLGWSDQELVGHSLLALVHPDDQGRTLEELRRLGGGQDASGLEIRLRHRNGSYRLTSWTAVHENGCVYAIGRDITEHRRIEEQLRQAQKMDAVGQLTGGIAHDFNNLLSGIMGSLDLMQRRIRGGRGEDLMRYISAAETSAQRAAALTQRLLAFSRRQALDLRPVDVNHLVASLEDLLERTIGENVRLVTRLGTDLPPALTDLNQLENALINLVINARDAMPAGGSIIVSTRLLQLRPGDAGTPGDLPAGDYLLLSVTDDGSGMTPDVIARAFDPFFTTKPIGQGTGLGLSMIYGFAKQSKGHVQIHSEPGLGSCVSLYLPSHEGPLHERPAGTDAAAPLGEGETILVVEDELIVRGLIVEILSELGYASLEASDAGEALALLESRQRIDLLVSDIGLPGLNGRQLAERARQLRPGLRVLFATGYAAGGLGGQLDEGMALITKPFEIELFATKVRGMLKRGR